MIDFRYHVVSIVAVFLALAVGIVLGTDVLSGDVLKNLKAETAQLRKDSQSLRTQNSQQQSQISGNQAFDSALEPIAIKGLLRGQHIAVVMLPGASKSVRDQVIKTLVSAGGNVTAQVEVASTYVDPTQQPTLDDLVRSVAPSAVDFTRDTTVSTRAAAVLANALVASSGTSAASPSAGTTAVPSASRSAGHSDSDGAAAKVTKADTVAAGPTPSSSRGASATLDTSSASPALPVDPADVAVLAALGKAGFVKVDQTPTEFATLAVLVAPAPPTKPTTQATVSDQASLDVIAAFQRADSGSVVAGPSGSAVVGGLLSQLRSDATITETVSGVDDVDTSAGQIALVFATVAEAAGQTGQYGTGGGAQGPLPTPPSLAASSGAPRSPTS